MKYFPFSEKVQHLKQLLRSVHKHKIETYLREKRYNENITVNNLSDIYVEPYVHDVEHNRQIKVEELLSPDPLTGKIPQKVLLYGPGGIGKTMAALSLLSMWVDGQLPSIENLFFFSMRELSLLRQRRCSLADLLFTHQGIQKPRADIVRQYFANMSQSLFIFEDCESGLYTSEWESEPIRYDTEVKVAKLVGSIICGKTMPGARVLVTARPGAVNEYHVFDRKAEMYGFDESRVDRYLSMYCAGSDTANDNIESLIRNYIDDNNNNIGSFCYVPMFCNLLCRIAKLIWNGHNQMYLPKTITQLLTTSVLTFAVEHHPDIKGNTPSEYDVIAHLKDPLLHHSKLAKEGMSGLPIKLLFSEDDLERWGLSKSTARLLSLLMVFKDKVQGPVSREDTELHCFVHFIMQEFLAAIGLVSNIDDIERQMADTPNLGQLDMVLTFVSGLVSDPANRHFLESLGFQTTVTAADLLRLIVKQDHENRRRDRKRTILLLLRLVYESRQPDLWAVIKDFVLNYAKDIFGNDVRELNLEYTEISPVELQALIYVMPHMDDFTMLT
ncbi:hypothetical protein NP493_1514g00023 [Ridgeia piscesae]|uniref:NACHT domain-containing protein n=1 Tax=Ridgeia piscesae TaxID=27915 RepID=A0AAD9NA68_RIDPI|nr:hypothetical protein NP493_1514g00023 [Ridgeia piscesae]